MTSVEAILSDTHAVALQCKSIHYSHNALRTYSMQYATVLVKLLPSESDSWELLGSQFNVENKLGEGNYGVVYKGSLSTDVSTAPAQRHMDTMAQEGKSPYTVAIKILKGEIANWMV